jgi:demethylmenaquinone methyltransferase/2-methoxy-6-polyprenyl-1,4-benzoquinol methylase
MANVFFDPGEQRATKVKALFGKIAPRYDLVNDLQSFGLHRYWKRRLVIVAAPRPGERALDLCCGTGDLAFALARRGGEVVGLDFSQPMLGMALAKAKGQRPKFKVQTTPSFVQGDAQELPFRADSFAIVTMGYGLRNLADWESGLREMQRVTKPGGRILVLDFGKPNNPLWRGIYFGYLRFFVPLLGRVFCGDAAAYGYILESLKHYAAQQGVAAKMQELGLVQCRTINLLGGVMSINFGHKA